uniref:Uncharacterized protein n=1 Tax=Anguilla anguilla TaxID=7936 RepID=A0A0E9RLG0_ANGAN
MAQSICLLFAVSQICLANLNVAVPRLSLY